MNKKLIPIILLIVVCLCVLGIPRLVKIEWDSELFIVFAIFTSLFVGSIICNRHRVFHKREASKALAVIIATVMFIGLFSYMFIRLPSELRPAFLVTCAISVPILWLYIRFRDRLFLRFLGIKSMEELNHKCEQGILKGLAVRKSRNILRSLSKDNIFSLDIIFNNESSIHIESPELVEVFKKYLHGIIVRLSLKDTIAKYDDGVQHFTLQIHAQEGSFSYVAVVHPKFLNDLILMPPKQTDSGGIRLRGLKRWLDENVLQNEEKI